MDYQRSWPSTRLYIEHYHRTTKVYTWKFGLVILLAVGLGLVGMWKLASYDYCKTYYGYECRTPNNLMK